MNIRIRQKVYFQKNVLAGSLDVALSYSIESLLTLFNIPLRKLFAAYGHRNRRR